MEAEIETFPTHWTSLSDELLFITGTERFLRPSSLLLDTPLMMSLFRVRLGNPSRSIGVSSHADANMPDVWIDEVHRFRIWGINQSAGWCNPQKTGARNFEGPTESEW
ncbi:hypothetical protein AVEN_250167-1 [Araneus ventricosus]|uniref:Uncharacterized protein n=1 Tax=Araneus ventricosus TaxID=182803 RepID=A0A4Y2MN99_ARAVE|nr:hypothetical protein AVEN_250167-1 [Araneus ventricosus]